MRGGDDKASPGNRRARAHSATTNAHQDVSEQRVEHSRPDELASNDHRRSIIAAFATRASEELTVLNAIVSAPAIARSAGGLSDDNCGDDL